MLIVKSLLHDLCSALGPYCIHYIGAKWSVFSDTVTYVFSDTVTYNYKMHYDLPKVRIAVLATTGYFGPSGASHWEQPPNSSTCVVVGPRLVAVSVCRHRRSEANSLGRGTLEDKERHCMCLAS